MLNLIKAALESANDEKLRIRKESEAMETDQLLEFTQMFEELSDLTAEGIGAKPGEIQSGMQRPHIDIPLQDDIELEALEINVTDGRVIGVPTDASVQESADEIAPRYSGMKTFNDFYTEAQSMVSRFPRETNEKYSQRVMEYARAEYAKYEDYCYQEGVFGHGKIDIGDPTVPSRVSMNFGPRNPEKANDRDQVINAKILYETDKKGRVTTKQIETALVFNCTEQPWYKSLYEPMFEAVKKRYNVPKNKCLWDVADIKNVLIPVKPSDKWMLVLVLETDFSNEKIYYGLSIDIKKSRKKNEAGEIKNVGEMPGDQRPGFKMLTARPAANFRTASEVRMERYEMNRPSRFGRFYSESIDLGGEQPNPTTAEPTPAAEPAAATPDAGATASVDAGAAPQPDNAENVDVNDVSDQIAANVATANTGGDAAANTADLENMPEPNMDNEAGDDMQSDPSIDNVGEVPPTDDLSGIADPTDVSADPTMNDDMGAAEDLGNEPTDDSFGGLSDEEMNNMSIEELIERGSDKLKSMSINQLKNFLSTGEMSAEDTGAEDVQEAAFYEALFTKASNVKDRINNSIKDCVKGFKKIIRGIEEEEWGYREFNHFWGQVTTGNSMSSNGDDIYTTTSQSGEYFGQRVNELLHYVHIGATKKRAKGAFTSEQISNLDHFDTILKDYYKYCNKASSLFHKKDTNLDTIASKTKRILEETVKMQEIMTSKEMEDTVIEEAAIVTKKNIKKTIDEHIKVSLGILNDVKRNFQDIVSDFKAESKKFNKVLTKACKMHKVFTPDQIDKLSKLNHCIVDLASYIEANNKSESYTSAVKTKIREFAKMCKVVGKFVSASVVNEWGDSCGPDVTTEDDDITAPTAPDTVDSTSDNIEGSDLGGVDTTTEGVQREERVRQAKARDAIQKQTGYDRATAKKIASDIDTVKAGSHRFDDFEIQGRAPAARASLRDKLLDPEIEGVVKSHSSATTPKFKYKTNDSISRAIDTSEKLDNAEDSIPKNAKDARKAIRDARDTVQTSGHKTLTTQQKGRTLDDDSVVDSIRNKK